MTRWTTEDELLFDLFGVTPKTKGGSVVMEITDTRLADTMREIHTMAFSFIRDTYLTPYRIRKMIESTRHKAFGSFIKSNLVGFLFVDNESEIPLPGKCIEHFVILPWHQKNGTGSSLLSYVINHVYPESIFHMGVDRKKEHIVNFYRKHGFEYCNDKHMILTRGKHV